MSESVGSAEFLLGVEEYLKYLKEDKTADMIHAFAKCIQEDNDAVQLVKTYIQHTLPAFPPELIHESDLCHSINKSITDLDIYKILLHYVSLKLRDTGYSFNKELSDLCHGINKNPNNAQEIFKVLLNYISKILKAAGLEELGIETRKIMLSINEADFENFVVSTQLKKLDRMFPKDKIFRGISSYNKLDMDRGVLSDAFSRSQLKSKIWLVEELAKIDTNYDNVMIMAGWFGQLKSIYDKRLTYAKMRIVELDRQACETSDYIFNLSNLENHKVKSVNADVNAMTLHKNGYEWTVENFREGTTYSEKFLPNLVINTSAEHMKEDWFFQLKFKELESNPIVAIQSNNLFDIPEHINCVHSVEHMKKKFPMQEVLYEGELQLKGYKRVMLIGRP